MAGMALTNEKCETFTGRRPACHSAESLFGGFMNIIAWGPQVTKRGSQIWFD